jgi:hypothetical protein
MKEASRMMAHESFARLRDLAGSESEDLDGPATVPSRFPSAIIMIDGVDDELDRELEAHARAIEGGQVLTAMRSATGLMAKIHRLSPGRWVSLLETTIRAASSTPLMHTEIAAILLLARSRTLHYLGRLDEATRDARHARSITENIDAPQIAMRAETQLAAIALEEGDQEGVDRNRASGRTLLIGPNARWFRLGAGPRVDLRRRRPARLILNA